VADITPRETQRVAFLLHSDYRQVLLKASGIDGVFYKYRKEPDAVKMPLLCLPEETPIDIALQHAKAPEVLGVIEKSSAQEGRLALRFDNIRVFGKMHKKKAFATTAYKVDGRCQVHRLKLDWLEQPLSWLVRNGKTLTFSLSMQVTSCSFLHQLEMTIQCFLYIKELADRFIGKQ